MLKLRERCVAVNFLEHFHFIYTETLHAHCIGVPTVALRHGPKVTRGRSDVIALKRSATPDYRTTDVDCLPPDSRGWTIPVFHRSSKISLSVSMRVPYL